MIVHTDCRHFRGDVPCTPHKRKGVHCESCPFYDPVDKKILIVKLGAIGDVIRTTPLLYRLEKEFPNSAVHWLTRYPEIVPERVDEIWKFGVESLTVLQQFRFDLLINLDKDLPACALAKSMESNIRRGFVLENGKCAPADDLACSKWLTGLFDDVNRRNTKSYPEEIFEICGFKYHGEEYILDSPEPQAWNLPSGGPLIGLNTGCGARWISRKWPEKHWIELARRLKTEKMNPVFLGGEQEHEENKRMAKQSSAIYPGHFPLLRFVDLVNQCDLVVTSVTMALHIALGLKKKVILFNNIFNPHEFELFGRGRILEPPRSCKGCFMNDCDKPCMELILPEQVAESIRELLE